jgi:cbb3-type cytochrome oxidase cytochrome c subunit
MIKEEIKNTSNGNKESRPQQALDLGSKSGVKIKQIYIKEIGAIDRCQSCHLGMTDEKWADAPQPFTSHTEPMLSYHPVYRFGCTSCHQGQGFGTTTQGGHGLDENWKDPLLPLNYIEASCNQCHADLTFREAPLLSRGKYLVRRLGCLGCHTAKAFDSEEKIGPVLNRIKFKAKAGWIRRFLKKPGDYSAETRMPTFDFKDEEIRDIQEFLIDLGSQEKKIYQKKSVAREQPPSVFKEMINGKELVGLLACTTCHTIKGVEEEGFLKPDKIGPELSKVGSKLKTEWLEGYLKDPSAYQPKSKMPKYRLNDREIKELTLFLTRLRWEDGNRPEEKKKASSLLPKKAKNTHGERVESGMKLIIKSNCIGCHEIRTITEGERGPSWDGLSGKPIRKFDFGNNPDQIERSKSAWIKSKILKPRSFRDSLKMPFLAISDKDAEAITTVLLSLTGKKFPKNYMMEKNRTTHLRDRIPMKGPVGKLWNELKCLQCHSVGGDGGDIGPDIAFEGSRVKPGWIAGYMMKPEMIRPISTARMPDLKLSEEEALLLGNFIEMALIDNTLPLGIIHESKVSKKSLKQGKKLFSRKYGCIGCHQVGGKGGKIGPDVSTLGKRLDGDWLHAYLKDPQSTLPDARMPNFVLSDDEINKLTDYLLSLGDNGQ